MAEESLLIDTDEDGLPDYFEKLINSGMLPMGNGIQLIDYPNAAPLSWDNPNIQDSDGDGISDGTEIEIKYADDGTYAWIKMNSNPCVMDTDGDELLDNEDPEPLIAHDSIVNQSLLDLLTSLERLEYLKEDLTVPVTNRARIPQLQQEAKALYEKVKIIGKKVNVTTTIISVPMLDYEKTISATEAVIFFSSKWRGAWVGMASLDAERFTEEFGPTDGSYYNAVNHALWNALAVAYTGDQVYVKDYTDAHEYGIPSNFEDSESLAHSLMDIFNNTVGRYYGGAVHTEGNVSPKSLYQTIVDCADNGELEVIVW